MKLQEKKKFEGKRVITKKETIQILRIRLMELNLFEKTARIPMNPNRKGYTFQEYKQLLKKAERFYGTIKKC